MHSRPLMSLYFKLNATGLEAQSVEESYPPRYNLLLTISNLFSKEENRNVTYPCKKIVGGRHLEGNKLNSVVINYSLLKDNVLPTRYTRDPEISRIISHG